MNEAYNLYLSLKLHFTTETYDYFKYRGKVKNRKITEYQKYIFQKISSKYENLELFFVANFLENPKFWINDFFLDESYEIYKKFLNKQESLTYIVKCDIMSLCDEFDDVRKIFALQNGFPILMKQVQSNKINLETLIILNSFINFLPIWDKKINDDIIWKPFSMKCKKYSPFVKYDKGRMKEIIKKEFIKL